MNKWLKAVELRRLNERVITRADIVAGEYTKRDAGKCECGNPRSFGKDACDRCLAFEARATVFELAFTTKGRVLSCVDDMGSVTPTILSRELGIRLRHADRILKQCVADGSLARSAGRGRYSLAGD